MKNKPQQPLHSQKIPKMGAAGDIYSPEFFLSGYQEQIRKIQEYYFESGWVKPDTTSIRCLYNSTPQFREMCDNNETLRGLLHRLFQEEQQTWDEHLRARMIYAENRLFTKLEEDKPDCFPLCISFSLAFLLEFWNDMYCSQAHINLLKIWLSHLYQNNHDRIRKRIEHEVLPVLFTVQEITIFFSDWQEQPSLQHAYEYAIRISRGKLLVPNDTEAFQQSFRSLLKHRVKGYTACEE